MFRACSLFVHSTKPNSIPFWVPLTPSLDPNLMSSSTRRGLYGRLVTAPFLSPGDNKPIWMHAEEREESKVALCGREGGGVQRKVKLGVCRGGAFSSYLP